MKQVFCTALPSQQDFLWFNSKALPSLNQSLHTLMPFHPHRCSGNFALCISISLIYSVLQLFLVVYGSLKWVTDKCKCTTFSRRVPCVWCEDLGFHGLSVSFFISCLSGVWVIFTVAVSTSDARLLFVIPYMLGPGTSLGSSSRTEFIPY